MFLNIIVSSGCTVLKELNTFTFNKNVKQYLLLKAHANGPNIVGPNNVVTCWHLLRIA